MTPALISKSFKQKVCREIQLEAEGLDRFAVYTPFQFDDGDHFVIILKRVGDEWVLTDEGHTFMHLSYTDVDLSSGTRAEIIERVLSSHRVENDQGELRLTVPGKDFGDALYSFVQALGRVAHTALWTHERVRSTFFEDVAELIETTVPMGRAQPNYVDPTIDPEGIYPIDWMVRGDTGRQWFLFAVSNGDHCQQATISCLHYEKRGAKFSGMVIFENQVAINGRKVAQLTDVIDKSFSSVGERERIQRYIEEHVVASNGKGRLN